LPLGDEAFATFVSLLVGSGWEELAKKPPVTSLGASIRRSLLERCLMRQIHSSSQAPSLSSQKSTKRTAHPPRLPRRPSQKSKKQKTHPANSRVRSRTTSSSTSSPATPRRLEQVYRIESFGVSASTYQANQHLGPGTPAVQAKDAEDVAVHPQDMSCDHDSSTSTPASDEHALHLCSGGHSPLAASTGAANWGSFGRAMNDLGRQDQGVEGAPRSAHHITNQRATEGGDMALQNGTETTAKTGESNGVQCEGKILCYRSRTRLIGMSQSRRSYAFQPQRRRLGELRRLYFHTNALPARALYAGAIRIRASLGHVKQSNLTQEQSHHRHSYQAFATDHFQPKARHHSLSLYSDDP